LKHRWTMLWICDAWHHTCESVSVCDFTSATQRTATRPSTWSWSLTRVPESRAGVDCIGESNHTRQTDINSQSKFSVCSVTYHDHAHWFTCSFVQHAWPWCDDVRQCDRFSQSSTSEILCGKLVIVWYYYNAIVVTFWCYQLSRACSVKTLKFSRPHSISCQHRSCARASGNEQEYSLNGWRRYHHRGLPAATQTHRVFESVTVWACESVTTQNCCDNVLINSPIRRTCARISWTNKLEDSLGISTLNSVNKVIGIIR